MAKTFFDSLQKTLLSEQEMKTLDRDLSFRPASPGQAQTLTPEQVGAFNRDGFLLPLPLLDSHQIGECRNHWDRLLETTLAAGSDSYSLHDVHVTDEKVYDLMFHPQLVAYVKDLIGSDIVCWGTHCFCKLPHDDRQVAWHQDAYYWPFTPSRTVTAWLAIDDADRENACMQFIKGSHRIGVIPHRVSHDDEKNVLRVTVDGVDTIGEIADVTLRAGQISLHADMMLHGSGPNTSDRRRCGLTFRFVDANVVDLRDWSAFGVLICGEDRRGQWGNPARPGRI
jgi:non-heme Fe2+,alpha-ketoglutarate-dependent halogenase